MWNPAIPDGRIRVSWKNMENTENIENIENMEKEENINHVTVT